MKPWLSRRCSLRRYVCRGSAGSGLIVVAELKQTVKQNLDMETYCAKIQMLFCARILQHCINKKCIRPGHSVQRTAVGSG